MTRNSLRSFAFGMMIPTLLITGWYFSNYATFQQEKKNNTTITEEAIIQYAHKNNFVLLTKEEYEQLSTEQEDLNIKKQAIEQPIETPKTPEEENKEKSNTIQESPNPVSIKLEVKSGMSSLDISEILAKNNIVGNPSEFERYLVKNNYSRYIQIGTYELSKKMSYEEIAKIITKK